MLHWFVLLCQLHNVAYPHLSAMCVSVSSLSRPCMMCAISFFFIGILVSAGQVEPCALTFYLTGTPQPQRVVFTGLTADERAWSGNTTTGWRLTCACVSNRGLTPLQWLDANGEVLPKNNKQQLVDFRVANSQPGSAVHLRINRAGFSCAEAGTYTCVVGSSTRTVLVTPVGECGKQCVSSNRVHYCAGRVHSLHITHL